MQLVFSGIQRNNIANTLIDNYGISSSTIINKGLY